MTISRLIFGAFLALGLLAAVSGAYQRTVLVENYTNWG